MATTSTPKKSPRVSAKSQEAPTEFGQLALLQQTVLQALDKVKAQNVQIFDTTELSTLFEQIIIASGSSNRQTKALATCVRDAVRDAGLPKPRIEGEENGEWIIVDCGQVVVHIMQPAIRQYYQLEDIWGEMPIERTQTAAGPVAKKAAKKAPHKAAPSTKMAQSTASTAPAKKATASAKKTVRTQSKSAPQAGPASRARKVKAPSAKAALDS